MGVMGANIPRDCKYNLLGAIFYEILNIGFNSNIYFRHLELPAITEANIDLSYTLSELSSVFHT